MQNKPQLSAEMEKLFKSWYSECGLDPENDETAMQHQQNGLNFLATALEEQRAEYVRKVESKKKEYWHIQFDGIDDPEEKRKRIVFNEEVTVLLNSVLDDVLGLLTQKKEDANAE
jgi:hypothetical protein